MMLTKQGDNYQVSLIDLDFLTDYTNKDFETKYKGTKSTMAPQYSSNKLKKNWKADVYAVGAILYELNGHSKFQSSNKSLSKS